MNKPVSTSIAMRMMAQAQESLNARDYRSATEIQDELKNRVLMALSARTSNHSMDELGQIASIAVSMDDLAPVRR